MRIIELSSADPAILEQAAEVLFVAFKKHWPLSWPDMNSAREELRKGLETGKIALAAMDEEGSLLGWIGAIEQYAGHTWELHPLAVHPSAQDKGIGSALVRALEERVGQRGGETIYLGTDDEDNMTSLSNRDLYSDLTGCLVEVHNLKHHPFGFYQRLGYTITGVIPDANGIGKPDIFMTKRL